MSKSAPFLGREEELKSLSRFLRKKSASLIVVKGRRRIGKSRLIEEFASVARFYAFSGLAPTKNTTAQSQRDEFSRQLSEQLGVPEVKADDWSKLFLLLADKIKEGRIVLLFDEISWMGSEDPDFPGKIKNIWDMKFKKNPHLIFVLCGSASYWIEKNILNSTGFLGRVSYTLTVEELPLKACNYFWRSAANTVSAFEKFKILSVTGGVPRYLEEIDPKLSAEENIKELCFRKGGILVDEFDHIFSNIFKRHSPLYREIIRSLVYGMKEASEICKELKIELSGLISEYFQELSSSGFIKRDHTWHIKTGQDAKLSKYRLSDNYLRFYLRYIDKYRSKIDRGSFEIKTIASLPELPTFLGLQFENLVLNNRHSIHEVLGLRTEDIVSENPFFQPSTTKQPGCQIDYLIQSKFDNLYVCEVKFSKQSIGMEVIKEMEQKISRLKRPKGFSCRPVLIHVNGVNESVVESEYFSSIIDMGALLL